VTATRAGGRQTHRSSSLRFVMWLLGERGDMVWNTVVIVAVLLPLASLALDIPRYYTLRSRLQLGADAAAEAAVNCVDIGHFQETGDVRLNGWCVQYEGHSRFEAAVSDLRSKGYAPALDSIAADEGQMTVAVQAHGTTQLFFGLSPRLTVHVAAASRYRMDRR
jgi:hypothetical protein